MSWLIGLGGGLVRRCFKAVIFERVKTAEVAAQEVNEKASLVRRWLRV